jgi:hypothetical protein
VEHGFNGVYLGDLERLKEIQSKRDTSNRNWQRIILYNVAKNLQEDSTEDPYMFHNGVSIASFDHDDKETVGALKTHGDSESPFPKDLDRKFVFETRKLWFKLHEKMQQAEYGNMLLLVRMRSELEQRMYCRKQRFLTFMGYEELVNKLHLDSAGHVVEPFVALSERHGECTKLEHQRNIDDSVNHVEKEEYMMW